MASRFVPGHVNETTDPVDNLGGILSVRAGRRARARHQLRARSRRGLAALVLGRDRASARASPSSSASAARRPRCTTSTWPAGASSGWRPCAGIIVFGSLMGAMFIGQQFLQNVLGYSTLEAGLGDPAGRGVHGARRAPLGEAHRGAGRRGSRCSPATCSACSASSRCSLLWKRGQPVLAGRRSATRSSASASGSRARRRRTRSPARCPVDACRDGIGDRRPPARPRRRDHAVDPRRAAHRRLCHRGRQADRGGAATPQVTASVQNQLEKSFAGARRWRSSIRSTPSRSRRRRSPSFLAGAKLGLCRRHHRGPARRRGGVLPLPEEGTGGRAAGPLSRPGHGRGRARPHQVAPG